ncbi:alpha/beta hydrolase family esterase [Sandaracinus amylolyticus]|uniref:Poly(3-hydroxyalkanoate) depolymerase n=1 Tax=Sandaracinus amylolyticus TaxID=927083 RepID=A0A0F6WA08_9BACT|nr:PHB depolymerase family esterase [Sandaracinus amylolyticus]AKF11211.1 Poly(3-hydroxyalkanoate) depolymerase [Sandaracinus amylolyticus]
MKKLVAALCVSAWLVGCEAGEDVGSTAGALSEVSSFGANPGALRMMLYTPSSARAGAPIVVVLHGCLQAASDAERTGWSTLADTYGFHVVYPQQTSSNNGATCFRWFEPAQVRRDAGEVASVVSMVRHVVATRGADASRVYVSGFSAGGGLAPALLATYPDVFAAGAANAGLPFGCASGVSEAFGCQNGGVDRSPAEWAARVRAAAPSGWSGPWPRIAIWQGTSDSTVRPVNATELVEQWTAIQGLDTAPESSETIGTLQRTRHVAAGRVAVEQVIVPGMGHAVAIHPSSGCGATGSYTASSELCAAREQARFFGLIEPLPEIDAGVAIDAGSSVDAGANDAGANDAGASTCAQHTSSNYAHERAGRATRCGAYGSYVCAVGSGQQMGFWNVYQSTTLRERPAGYFEIGACP